MVCAWQENSVSFFILFIKSCENWFVTFHTTAEMENTTTNIKAFCLRFSHARKFLLKRRESNERKKQKPIRIKIVLQTKVKTKVILRSVLIDGCFSWSKLAAIPNQHLQRLKHESWEKFLAWMQQLCHSKSQWDARCEEREQYWNLSQAFRQLIQPTYNYKVNFWIQTALKRH